MKTGVLMVWTGCLVSITLSVLHFAWIATAVERVLVLALLGSGRKLSSGPSEIRRNLYAKNYAPDLGWPRRSCHPGGARLYGHHPQWKFSVLAPLCLGHRPCPPWRRLAKAPVIYIFSLPCYNSKK